MMSKWTVYWPLIIMACVPLLGSTGSRAIVRNGNIYIYRTNGALLQITASGLDSQPDVTEDGTEVVFVRSTGPSSSELWLASTNSLAPVERLVVKMPIEINGRRFSEVYTPRFSPDGAMVYFLVPYAGSTQAIVKVNILDPQPKLVAAALSFEVVPAGRYRGDLIARIRKAKLAPGYYEWYWLLTPEGKELGVVGQDERDVSLFMEQ